MPPTDDFKASLVLVDAATTKLGTNSTNLSAAVDGASIRVAAVIDKLSTSMSAEDVAAAKATLDAETTKLDNVSLSLDAMTAALNGMAHDPAQPVPPMPAPVPVPAA